MCVCDTYVTSKFKLKWMEQPGNPPPPPVERSGGEGLSAWAGLVGTLWPGLRLTLAKAHVGALLPVS